MLVKHTNGLVRKLMTRAETAPGAQTARLDLGELRGEVVSIDSLSQAIRLPSSAFLEMGAQIEVRAELFVPQMDRDRVVWVYELRQA